MQIKYKHNKLFAIPLLIIFVFLLCLFGCTSKTPAEVLEDSVKAELESYKNENYDALENFSKSMDIGELDQFGITTQEFSKSFFDGFNYSIDTIYVGEDSGDVYVSLIAKDYSFFEDQLKIKSDELEELSRKSFISNEDFKQQYGELILQILDDSPLKRYQNIDIKFTKDGNTWRPETDIVYLITETIIESN